ncbi:MAG TPA: ABC transporter substrate-binding protein [Gemmatimonadales bacterium]|nr:ABC transporter substrate-binding protein [Gemmatimonadales bacterium]
MAGPQPRSPTTRALLGGLRELGYVYGEHFVTEPRGGEGKPERFPALAAELVRRQVDVIVSAGPPAMLAAVKQATSTIPETAARALGRKLLPLEILDAGESAGAFKTATAAGAGALLVFPGGIPDAHARRIAQLAAASRLPAMYAFRYYVEAGGLISYGADLIANNRRAAAFVDKILKGAKPADLPFEQPAKFELVINLGAAKLLGLTIPQSLLLRADQVVR